MNFAKYSLKEFSYDIFLIAGDNCQFFSHNLNLIYKLFEKQIRNP